jgi:CBS domain containing-hemolysin-like protein
MSFPVSLLALVLLVGISGFFSVSEISLAASNRLRLAQLAEKGDPKALRVLRTHEQPGRYFTVVQIGLNSVAILGGILGEGYLSPYLLQLMQSQLSADTAHTASFITSFVLVTSVFIIFADLFPRRLGMVNPEKIAIVVATPMQFFITALSPVIWIFSKTTDGIFNVLKLPKTRIDQITSEDILTMTKAGGKAGLLAKGEQHVIETIFDLDNRTVSSAMTARDRIAWFDKDDSDATIRARIIAAPFSTYPVCDGDIDRVMGYVDSKDLFQRVLTGQTIELHHSQLIYKPLLIPDKLNLTEVLEQFRSAQQDFALILNEYSMVVGVITLNDVMNTVMGELVSMQDESLIIKRDDNSWLMEGVTPIRDVLHALEIDHFPDEDDYETLAGFFMANLRRVPKRTDVITSSGFRFEVLDVDNYRIDQVMVSRVSGREAAQ